MSEWYYVVSGAQKGPVSADALKSQLGSGALPRTTLVWKEGMGPWMAANTLPEFSALAPPPPPTFSTPPPPPPDMQPPPAPVDAKATAACATCKAPAIPNDHGTTLCEPCRTKLVAFPIPAWIYAVGVVVVIAMLFAAIRVPRATLAYYRFERGVVAEEKHDYAGASAQYALVLAAYPQSIDALNGEARAAFRAGNRALAVECTERIMVAARKKGELSKESAAVIQEVEGGSHS